MVPRCDPLAIALAACGIGATILCLKTTFGGHQLRQLP
jgi:hypothetical protein